MGKTSKRGRTAASAESGHNMILRSKGTRVFKENWENEDNTETAANTNTDDGEGEIGDEGNELFNVKRYLNINSIQQYVSNSIPQYISGKLIVLLLYGVILLSQSFAFPECEKRNSLSFSKGPLEELSVQFPQHKDMWKALNVTVRIIHKGGNARGVTLLLHNGDGSAAECLVNCTATLLSRLIGVSEMGEYMYVDGRNAHELYEKESFLEEVIEKIKNLGVVVFNHLELLHIDFVEKLLFICDPDPNFSQKAIVIFLLKVEGPFSGQYLNELADKKLKELWTEKLHDKCMPILARITNSVGSIDENTVTKCP